MKELSLNILDIAENSVKAKASEVDIIITETEETLELIVSDNGTGMTKEIFEGVTDPFTTTRTTRKVGLGIPFLKLAAEQTGGHFSIETRYIGDYPDCHGTKTKALFYKNHMDFTPLGDVISTIVTLIQGSDNIDWNFSHTFPDGAVELHTAELREVLGDVPLSNAEVLMWIKGFLEEQYSGEE